MPRRRTVRPNRDAEVVDERGSRYGSHAGVIKFLTHQGFDIHERTEKGLTPLTVACCRYWSNAQGKLYSSSQLKSVAWLIRNGTEMNTKEPLEAIALYAAIKFSGNKLLTQYLVNAGANIHYCDSIGAFTFIANVERNLQGMILFLVNNAGSETRSRMTIRSNAIDFLEKLHAIEIKTVHLSETDFTPLERMPRLRESSYWTPDPRPSVYTLHWRWQHTWQGVWWKPFLLFRLRKSSPQPIVDSRLITLTFLWFGRLKTRTKDGKLDTFNHRKLTCPSVYFCRR